MLLSCRAARLARTFPDAIKRLSSFWQVSFGVLCNIVTLLVVDVLTGVLCILARAVVISSRLYSWAFCLPRPTVHVAHSR